jgi:uncharacterized protein (DUF1810 family)
MMRTSESGQCAAYGQQHCQKDGKPRRPETLRPASRKWQRATMSDPYDLQRFVDAQRMVYRNILAELKQGDKRSHWMWFIFPQVIGLGFSSMAERFAIASPEEAIAYLEHEVLGARLRECTHLVLDVRGKTAHDIFGSPDDLKFRSSMTLFGAVSDDPIFGAAIARYYGGDKDQATLGILARIVPRRNQL